MNKYTLIPLSEMKIDLSYQRYVDEARVKKIASEWDDMKANIIHVSHRPDGYYVVDGNHTRLAYEKVGGKELPCRVHEGLTVKDEARLFYELNSSQKKPTFNEVFKAKVAAGCEFESSYLKLLDESNIPFTFTNSEGCKIKCHSAMLNVYKKTTYATMLRALNVARRAADGRETFYKIGFFPGLCSVVINHPEIKDERLIKIVQSKTSSVIRDMSEKYKKGVAGGTNSATAQYRKAYISFYNTGLPAKSRIIEEGVS